MYLHCRKFIAVVQIQPASDNNPIKVTICAHAAIIHTIVKLHLDRLKNEITAIYFFIFSHLFSMCSGKTLLFSFKVIEDVWGLVSSNSNFLYSLSRYCCP